MISNAELQAAFNQTDLLNSGISFNKAMCCEMLKKCLTRIAMNMKKNAVNIPVKDYWWNKN